MSYILSRKYARLTDSIFVIAAARAFYVDWYLSDEKREAKISGPGVELTNVVPETQRWAFEMARKFTAEIEVLCFGHIKHVLREWEMCWEGDLPYSEENAGWYAAMQAMGHGVGLWDYGIEIELPRKEACP